MQTARIADLNKQLQQTKAQAAAYLEKNRHQDQAILSAQRELGRLLKTIRKLESENAQLQQEIRTIHDLNESDRLNTATSSPEKHSVKPRDIEEEGEKSKKAYRKQAIKSIGIIEAIQVRNTR